MPIYPRLRGQRNAVAPKDKLATRDATPSAVLCGVSEEKNRTKPAISKMLLSNNLKRWATSGIGAGMDDLFAMMCPTLDPSAGMMLY
jgi:hypothetical protein